jgi:hypothetical protein
MYNLNYTPTTLGVQSRRESISAGTRTRKVQYHCSRLSRQSFTVFTNIGKCYSQLCNTWLRTKSFTTNITTNITCLNHVSQIFMHVIARHVSTFFVFKQGGVVIFYVFLGCVTTPSVARLYSVKWME